MVDLKTSLLSATLLAALAASSAGAAQPDPAKPRPAQALEQARHLLETIRQAGLDEAPLDRERVERLFGVRTGADCREFDSPQGRQHSCRYVPLKPQPAPIRFADYVAARLGPGPMQGGNVTWELDPARLCLRQRDLEQAFGMKPGRARHPVFADYFPGSRYIDTRSYDFSLRELYPEANYVAVYEVDGCIARLTLSTSYRSGW